MNWVLVGIMIGVCLFCVLGLVALLVIRQAHRADNQNFAHNDLYIASTDEFKTTVEIMDLSAARTSAVFDGASTTNVMTASSVGIRPASTDKAFRSKGLERFTFDSDSAPAIDETEVDSAMWMDHRSSSYRISTSGLGDFKSFDAPSSPELEIDPNSLISQSTADLRGSTYDDVQLADGNLGRPDGLDTSPRFDQDRLYHHKNFDTPVSPDIEGSLKFPKPVPVDYSTPFYQQPRSPFALGPVPVSFSSHSDCSFDSMAPPPADHQLLFGPVPASISSASEGSLLNPPSPASSPDHLPPPPEDFGAPVVPPLEFIDLNGQDNSDSGFLPLPLPFEPGESHPTSSGLLQVEAPVIPPRPPETFETPAGRGRSSIYGFGDDDAGDGQETVC